MCQITPILRSPSGRGASIVAATRLPHGVELVVAGDDLERAVARVAEDDEVPDQGEEAALSNTPSSSVSSSRRPVGRESPSRR